LVAKIEIGAIILSVSIVALYIAGIAWVSLTKVPRSLISPPSSISLPSSIKVLSSIKVKVPSSINL
jgi:hypothetical protein